ncbi:polysaccharide deacetylase family protein (plasmid) [Alicycliphilus denitrificans]|uniref:Polysaccharide deacetylase family protein n=1 Tax=Alicycliphilus denitrificans TaxID=179636 RepID=A0A858ZMV3_9BURK|nr:polysaccharide deacetylase family protein [Alicycliphilus denitrificans]QKD42087.1 polysaccharide deacetylase family protein [Alicycliphilus denitrificans]QKD42115.1 polysaccharide deacetylase family protein [Alicycliphilus denitrificans]
MQIKHHDRYGYSPIHQRAPFEWPGGKRLAFYVALNIERFSFGEGLGHTPTALGPPPDTRNYGWRDYGLRVGIWRVFDLMDALGLPMCHLLNASVCEAMPQIPERIVQRGDEVVGHGYTNSERQSEMDEDTERRLIVDATETLQRHCGQRPLGWMGPWIAETPVTPDLLKEAGYTYVMDWPADDQPFWMRTRAGPLLSVPYPIEINDSPVMLSRHQPATDFHQMVIDQFEEMLELSQQQSLVFGISLHTFVAGQPFRLRQIRSALQHIMQHPRFVDVWVTTPGGIAAHAASLPAGTVP